MTGHTFRAALRALAIATLLLFGATAPAWAQRAPLHVYAASSLTDALNRVGDLYAARGHQRPVFNYAASSTLARQIEQGAQADLFISADEDWMNYLAARELIHPGARVSFLSNRLVLIAPSDRPLHLRIARGFALALALGGGRLAMADPDSVPAGRYGRDALQHLGVWEQASPLVVRAENVRAALHFVEVGEAAAGIVYLTDARASTRVTIAGTFPASSHTPISYPMAAVSGGELPATLEFQRFLRSPAATAVFRGQGFVTR